MTVIRPLNYIPYQKDKALAVLKDEVGYKEYGRKHGESRFTKFFQNYYLPAKFNVDKRRPHLSSQILSGELTRSEAMNELEKPLYDEAELEDDKNYIAKKLGISLPELEQMTLSPGHHYSDYPNWDRWYKTMKTIQGIARKYLNKNLKNYS